MDKIDRIVRNAGNEGATLTVPPACPYLMVNSWPNIPFVSSNVPIIGMVLVHENVTPEAISAEDLYEATRKAVEEGSSEDYVAKALELSVKVQVLASMVTWNRWYLILVACEQVKNLSASNLSNFCSMTGAEKLPATAIKFIRYFAANIPSLAGNAQVRDMFRNDLFFKYHTAASTSGTLCKIACDHVGIPSYFSPSEVSLIDAAASANYDISAARAIPNSTLIKARAVLDALGMLPETWYQGQKALDISARLRYDNLVKLLKRMYEITNKFHAADTDQLDVLLGKISSLIGTNLTSDLGEDVDEE